MSRKNQVSYTKPDPPFLRRIREQVGYQEITDIDTKKQTLDRANDLEDQDDEKPTVVITENSNVTKEEQEDFAEKLTEVKPAKILFKKPVKKSEDAQPNEGESTRDVKGLATKQTSLKRPLEDVKTKEKEKEEDKAKRPKQKEKSNRLLSFGDDDEEEF